MFVMLLGSIANAQTFDFECETGPLTHAERKAVLTAYNSIDGISNIEVEIVNEGFPTASVYLDWDLNGGSKGFNFWYFSSPKPTINSTGDVSGDLSALSPEQFETYRERLYNHLINSLPPTIEEELQAIYAADTPPTELGTIINDAAIAVEYAGTVGHTPRTNFMKSLAYFNVSVDFVFNYPDKPSEVELSNGNVVPNIGTNSSINNMNPAQFAVFAFEVVKRFWHIGHPTYAADQAKAQLRAERTETVKMLGNDDVEVRVSLDTVEGNIIGISNTGGEQYIYVQLYDLSNQTGFVGLEDLQEGEFTLLKNAVTSKVNELTPTVAKELNAIFSSDTAPTGSYPEWLPSELRDLADAQINGTARATLFKNSFLSAHGITITQDNLYLVLSEGGYDHYINWGDYSSLGWTKMTVEKYRELVFNVIKDGWRHRNETFDDERGAIINNNFDTTGLDVKIETFITGNRDWWIYFNDVAVISGGADFENDDKNYNNEYTPNIHDAHMSEAVYQRLLVFVQYMIDNQSRLKGITTSFDRSSEISDLVGSFDAQVSVTILSDGTYHYTFSKNGISSQPVQTNWTHGAGTTLALLNADGFVKFYAKCRGILIGL